MSRGKKPVAPIEELVAVEMPRTTLWIGINIRRLLFERNRRPAWLAREAGVAGSALCRMLNPPSYHANPTLETLIRIAGVFGVPVPFLLSDPEQD